MIMFGIIENLIMKHPILRKSVTKSTRTQIQLTNRSQITALPCGPDGASLRGFTADLVVMDEAAFMPEDVIASVIFPMLATTNGTAIMLSTPWGRDHIYYRSFKNPNYWSQHVKAEQCPLITPAFLEEQRRDIGELRYKMEYEAEFVEDQNSFFKQDLIRNCIQDYDLISEEQLISENKIAGNHYLGADFGKKVDYSVITLLKQEENSESHRLIYLKQFPLGTMYTDIIAHIQRLNTKFEIAKGYVDQGAAGESLIEEIRQFSPQIDGLTFTAKTKQDLLTLLQTRMEQKRLILPLDRALLAQINEQKYRFSKSPTKPTEKPTETGTITFYHPQGTHDDQLWALALATHATKQKETEPYLKIIKK
jgi:phage FluMu gp28-like protein